MEPEESNAQAPAGFPVERLVVRILSTLVILTAVFLYLLAVETGKPEAMATVKMTWGVIALSIALGGALMYRFKDQARAFIQRLPLDWRVSPPAGHSRRFPHRTASAGTHHLLHRLRSGTPD